jgi:uncharacterized protein involved in outer membrane biogenesis
LKKVAITLAVLLVVLIAGGVYYTLSSLDGLVESAIEKYGSEMTGCRVRVGSVEIRLAEGRGTIRDVRVSNPAGFSSADAFALGEITLDIDLESVTKSPIVLDAVVISKPDAVFEINADGKTNMQVILDNLDRYSAPGEDTGTAPSGADPASDLLIRITRFTFEQGDVAADTRAVGGKQFEVPLPPLEMKGVGGRSGASGAEIGQTIMTAYTAKVVKLLAAQQLDQLIDDKLGGEAGEAAKQLLKVFSK